MAVLMSVKSQGFRSPDPREIAFSYFLNGNMSLTLILMENKILVSVVRDLILNPKLQRGTKMESQLPDLMECHLKPTISRPQLNG